MSEAANKAAEEFLMQVSALEIKPGSLVVIRVKSSATARQIVESLEGGDHSNLPEGCSFIFQYPPFAEFTSLDEDAMRRLGWQRCEPAE